MHHSPRHFRLIHEIIRIGNHTNHTFFSRQELFTLEIVQLLAVQTWARCPDQSAFFPVLWSWHDNLVELDFKVHLHTNKFCEVFDRAQIAYSVNLRILKDVCCLYQFWFFLRLKTEYLFSRLIHTGMGRFADPLLRNYSRFCCIFSAKCCSSLRRSLLALPYLETRY